MTPLAFVHQQWEGIVKVGLFQSGRVQTESEAIVSQDHRRPPQTKPSNAITVYHTIAFRYQLPSDSIFQCSLTFRADCKITFIFQPTFTGKLTDQPPGPFKFCCRFCFYFHYRFHLQSLTRLMPSAMREKREKVFLWSFLIQGNEITSPTSELDRYASQKGSLRKKHRVRVRLPSLLLSSSTYILDHVQV